MARIVLVRRNREAGERDAWRSGRDAVDLLPVVRPRREVLVREAEHRLADLHFVDRAVAQHLRQLPERLTLYSRLVPVEPLNPVLPTPNGSKMVARENLPMRRVCVDTW